MLEWLFNIRELHSLALLFFTVAFPHPGCAFYYGFTMTVNNVLTACVVA